MPDSPSWNISHKPALSELFSFPDDVSFDSDIGFLGCMNTPLLLDDAKEDLFPLYIDPENFNTSAEISGEGLCKVGDPPDSAVQHRDILMASFNDMPKFRHQHSSSLDTSTEVKSEILASELKVPSKTNTKKAMARENLAHLALVDPKRARRIWTNRRSAARWKENKKRYDAELEQKVKTLQTKEAMFSAQFNILQRDNNGLSAENKELKLRLRTIQQQATQQDALIDAMRQELQIVNLATERMAPNIGMMNFGPSFERHQQFYEHNQAVHSFGRAQQLNKSLPIHSLQQQQFHQRQQPLSQIQELNKASPQENLSPFTT